MTQYINLTDVNVDGCGTDVATIIKIEGSVLSRGTIDGIKEVIDNYKSENEGCWDTNGCITAAFEQLEKAGFEPEVIDFAAQIEF